MHVHMNLNKSNTYREKLVFAVLQTVQTYLLLPLSKTLKDFSVSGIHKQIIVY